MSWSSKTLLAALLSALALLAGCGGASFNGQVYRGQGMAFQVGPVPGSWRRIEVSHALLAYRDESAEATIALNGRCNKDGDDVPLAALTHHLFLMFTDRNIVSQRTLAMDGRAAMRTERRLKPRLGRPGPRGAALHNRLARRTSRVTP